MKNFWLHATALLVLAVGLTGSAKAAATVDAHAPTRAHSNAARAAGPATCVLFSDSSMDAAPMAGPVAVSLGNANYVDLVSFGLHTASGSLIATITTQPAFLGDTGFPLTGGDWWEVDFTFKGVKYYVNAAYPSADATQVPPGVPGSYGWGTISAGSHSAMSPAITGSIDVNGTTITIHLPLNLIAGLDKPGASLTNLGARSFATLGAQVAPAPGDANLFIADDDQAAGITYAVGKAC